MKVNQKNDKVSCIIDTMQLTNEVENFKDVEIVKRENFSYITVFPNGENAEGEKIKVFKVNPNRLREYCMLESLSLHNEAMEEIMQQLGVVDSSKVELNRVDIAIDSQMNYKENFKFLLFLFEVATYRDERSDRWHTTNLNTLEENSIKLFSNSVEVCFYNKAEESGNRHTYNSRMEWRFKRISHKDYKKHIDKLIDRLQYIENNVEPLEINMSKRLIRLWTKEKEQLQSFSEFVRKYNKYFYTSNIVKMVYAESGLKGSCKGWLDGFRRTNNSIELFTKKDINDYKKMMIKAVKNYKKN